MISKRVHHFGTTSGVISVKQCELDAIRLPLCVHAVSVASTYALFPQCKIDTNRLPLLYSQCCGVLEFQSATTPICCILTSANLIQIDCLYCTCTAVTSHVQVVSCYRTHGCRVSIKIFIFKSLVTVCQMSKY